MPTDKFALHAHQHVPLALTLPLVILVQLDSYKTINVSLLALMDTSETLLANNVLPVTPPAQLVPDQRSPNVVDVKMDSS